MADSHTLIGMSRSLRSSRPDEVWTLSNLENYEEIRRDNLKAFSLSIAIPSTMHGPDMHSIRVNELGSTIISRSTKIIIK
jgi:hypothetical protein